MSRAAGVSLMLPRRTNLWIAAMLGVGRYRLLRELPKTSRLLLASAPGRLSLKPLWDAAQSKWNKTSLPARRITMRRFVLSLAACVIVAIPAARAQTPADLSQTAAYVAAFQNPDGGFASNVGGTSTLGSTSSALRSLKYAGGSIPNVRGCIAYVKSCFDPQSGGFATTPGGKPDVNTTAVGLMAIAELRIANDEMVEKAIKFLHEHVTSFEDIRIAVAGLEAVRKTSPDFADWTAKVNADRNPDGTWGQGPAQAFATGAAAVALLRMGVELTNKDAVIAAMKAGQRSDGGWSKGGGP